MTYKILDSRYPNRAFTLIELLIVVAIIALLAAILFPVFSRARENARRTSCASNLKQMALGIHQYLQDYDERFLLMKYSGSQYVVAGTETPTTACTNVTTTPTTCAQLYWPDFLAPYLKSGQIFNDPSKRNTYFDGCRFLAGSNQGAACVENSAVLKKPWIYQSAFISMQDTDGKYRRERSGLQYGYFTEFSASTVPLSLSQVAYPSQKLMIGESVDKQVDLPSTGFCGKLAARHFEGSNIGFVDGHVKWVKWSFQCLDENTNDETKQLWFVNGVDSNG